MEHISRIPIDNLQTMHKQASGEEKRDVGAKPKSRSIRAIKNTSIGSNYVGLEAGLFIDNIEVFGVAASSW